MSCAICGSRESLIIHHKSYNPEITEFLCRSCHGTLHKLGKGPNPPIKVIKVSDEAHSELVAIAAYLTMETRKKKTIADAIEHLLENKRREIEK